MKRPALPRWHSLLRHSPATFSPPGGNDVAPDVAPGRVLRTARSAALVAITLLVTASAAASFAESYRALYDWARGHSLAGVWALGFPLEVDVFIAVGELALFVALADGWARRSRTGAWLVTLAGLAVSVAGNVGHIASHHLANRATAAVPPLAAAAALAVGLGVLKRVVGHGRQAAESGTAAAQLAPEIRQRLTDLGPGIHESAHGFDPVPSSVTEAAKASLRATIAAGNPWSVNQLQERFSLTRAQAAKLRTAVLAEANGHPPG